MVSPYSLLQIILTPISHHYHICMTTPSTNETQLLGSPECETSGADHAGRKMYVHCGLTKNNNNYSFVAYIIYWV